MDTSGIKLTKRMITKLGFFVTIHEFLLEIKTYISLSVILMNQESRFGHILRCELPEVLRSSEKSRAALLRTEQDLHERPMP